MSIEVECVDTVDDVAVRLAARPGTVLTVRKVAGEWHAIISGPVMLVTESSKRLDVAITCTLRRYEQLEAQVKGAMT